MKKIIFNQQKRHSGVHLPGVKGEAKEVNDVYYTISNQ